MELGQMLQLSTNRLCAIRNKKLSCRRETARRFMPLNIPLSHSRSSYTTYYWSVIVNITLSCTIFELFDLKNMVTFKVGLKGHSRSLKWYHSKAW